MNILFVEKLKGNLQDNEFQSPDFRIVALTPEAMDQLNKGLIQYRIPEDYHLWRETPAYTRWLLDWLMKFEDVVGEYHPQVKGLDIPMTIHCITMLKNVMDVFIRNTAQYYEILKAERPERVNILYEDKDDVIDDTLFFRGPSIYRRLVGWEEGESVAYRFKVGSFAGGRWFDWVRYLRFIPSWKGNEKVCFVYPPLKDRVREAKLSGYRVSFLPAFEPNARYGLPLSHIPSFLFADIDNEFGFNPGVSEYVLRERLKYFVRRIVPAILDLKEKYVGYFRRNRFSSLVFCRRNKLYHYAALIAAREVGLRTVYIRHGWDAYTNEGVTLRKWTRFLPFDCFVTPTVQDREYYQGWVEKEGLKTVVI